MTPLELDNQNGTATHQLPSNSRSCQLQMSLVLGFAVVVLLVIFCVSVGIAWLTYNPRLPVVALNSLRVSNFTLFKSNLTGNGNMNVTLRNPNKRTTLKLDNLKSSVLYGKTVLSKTADSMADIYLGKRSQKVYTAGFRFEGRDGISGCEKVLKDWGWKRSNGVVNLAVEMLISTKFVAGNWPSRRESTRVRCEVELSPASNGLHGKLLHGGKDCRVDYSINSS